MKKVNEEDVIVDDVVLEHDIDKPLLIFKLGSSELGWIPGKKHFVEFKKLIKECKLDKKYNILIYHFGMTVER